MATAPARQATIHRMVMPEHTCPYGLKATDLPRRQGYAVDDHRLTTREESDAFKAKHGVKTTPRTFIASERVGGYDDLRRLFGKTVRDAKAITYRPVVAVFPMTALIALAASYAMLGTRPPPHRLSAARPGPQNHVRTPTTKLGPPTSWPSARAKRALSPSLRS